MQLEGHEKIVELVNRALGGAFPEAELRLGSGDPDTKTSGRSYAGPLSKHHFDPGASETGRYHGSDTITSIVFSQCKAARALWLGAHYLQAAFEFGVATHYFMDGLICSPSVNEDVHASGDYEFSRTARKLKPTPVACPDDRRFGGRFLVAEISAMSGRFGRTNADDVPAAYSTLLMLGYAVTAQAVPVGLQQRLAAGQQWLVQKLKEAGTAFTQACNFQNQRLPAIVAAIAGSYISKSRILWFFLAVAEFNRRNRTGWSLLAMIVTPLVTKKIAHQVVEPVQNERRRSVGTMSDSAQKTAAPIIEWDREWFRFDSALRAHAADCRRRLDESKNSLEETWTSQQSTARDSVADWCKRWLDKGLPSRWSNSVPDKIGNNRATSLAVSVGAIITGVIIGVIVGAMGSKAGAIAAAAPFLLGSLIVWRTWQLCSRISKQLWHKATVFCPGCKKRFAVESLPGESVASCPICGAANLPLVIASSDDRQSC